MRPRPGIGGARRAPGRAGADTRRSSREGLGSYGRRPSARVSRSGQCGAGEGRGHVGRRTGLSGLVAGECLDHPSPPRPHSGRTANLRRAPAPRRQAPFYCGALGGCPGLTVPQPAWLRAAEAPRDPEVPTPAPTFQTRTAPEARGCPRLPAPSPVPALARTLGDELAPGGSPRWCKAPHGKPEPTSRSSLGRTQGPALPRLWEPNACFHSNSPE